MSIKGNLAAIRERMAAAARRSSRDPEAVRLVAVTKNVPWERIQEAADCGQRLFGENYLQEAQAKIPHLGPGVSWHFIGRLQSNKARPAAELFEMVETVDRLKVAQALDRQLAAAGRTLPVLVQVNIGQEPQKAGVLPEESEALVRAVSQLPRLKLRGLMALPPFFDAPEAARPYFRKLRLLAEKLASQGLLGREGPVELSMGMSGDFEVAIEEGATLVRVGTALFGARG